jgi:hypothetical protein
LEPKAACFISCQPPRQAQHTKGNEVPTVTSVLLLADTDVCMLFSKNHFGMGTAPW